LHEYNGAEDIHVLSSFQQGVFEILLVPVVRITYFSLNNIIISFITSYDVCKK